MRVFVTGANGFVGSAVVKELIAAGHTVLGLVRSEEAAAAVVAAGATVQRGTLEDLDGLRRGAAACEGVIHTAFIHDFKDLAAAGETDRRAIAAMGDTLAGSGKPLITTSGLAHLPTGRAVTEADGPNLNAPVRHRIPSDQLTEALATQGVRAMLLRLPPTVHGDGDHGFVPRLIDIARAKESAAYVGEGRNRWPAVHRLDAARLYRLALEQGKAGARYHAVAEEGVPTREIARMIGKRLGLPVVSKSGDNVAAHFGWLGHFFAVDCPASSATTQQQLGWAPKEVGLIEDLERGRYF